MKDYRVEIALILDLQASGPRQANQRAEAVLDLFQARSTLGDLQWLDVSDATITELVDEETGDAVGEEL